MIPSEKSTHRVRTAKPVRCTKPSSSSSKSSKVKTVEGPTTASSSADWPATKTSPVKVASGSASKMPPWRTAIGTAKNCLSSKASSPPRLSTSVEGPLPWQALLLTSPSYLLRERKTSSSADDVQLRQRSDRHQDAICLLPQSLDAVRLPGRSHRQTSEGSSENDPMGWIQTLQALRVLKGSACLKSNANPKTCLKSRLCSLQRGELAWLEISLG